MAFFKIELLRLNDSGEEFYRKYCALLKCCITAFLVGFAIVVLVAIAHYSNIDILKRIILPVAFVVVALVVIGGGITVAYMLIVSIVRAIKYICMNKK
ncbi:hypothetical protein AGMMS50229_00700 [Campylobacterota bacterium]|nr:hypothetical protein AGMMS50229_00700 [Campylobacterota bacterium]